MIEAQWNKTLPPVDCDVLVACKDGTVWKVRRDTWVDSREADPGYCCKTTGHPIELNTVIGWRYP